MEIHQHQENIENNVKKQIEGGEKLKQENQQEFSFTISLNSSSTTFIDDKSKAPPSSLAVDLSPADDIFFHGHLLPLHILSDLPSLPPSSANSTDSFTLPIRELLKDESLTKNNNVSCSTSNRSNITIDTNKNNNIESNITIDTNKNNNIESNNIGTKEESNKKSKPAFSLFGLAKWQKGCQDRDKGYKRITKGSSSLI
ncbi:hypothetical protein TanjilG_14655 [Lupinus angustifolius]|uniref:Uncharacterized protein n=1 Tax=Lupinus angustifolius TaxID=3871 RepID=A0A1J7GSK2_LUPAN|nr:hypothetical protein TanjilG_14655 [Lupinus angustifolius]